MSKQHLLLLFLFAYFELSADDSLQSLYRTVNKYAKTKGSADLTGDEILAKEGIVLENIASKKMAYSKDAKTQEADTKLAEAKTEEVKTETKKEETKTKKEETQVAATEKQTEAFSDLSKATAEVVSDSQPYAAMPRSEKPAPGSNIPPVSDINGSKDLPIDSKSYTPSEKVSRNKGEGLVLEDGTTGDDIIAENKARESSVTPISKEVPTHSMSKESIDKISSQFPVKSGNQPATIGIPPIPGIPPIGAIAKGLGVPPIPGVTAPIPGLPPVGAIASGLGIPPIPGVTSPLPSIGAMAKGLGIPPIPGITQPLGAIASGLGLPPVGAMAKSLGIPPMPGITQPSPLGAMASLPFGLGAPPPPMGFGAFPTASQAVSPMVNRSLTSPSGEERPSTAPSDLIQAEAKKQLDNQKLALQQATDTPFSGSPPQTKALATNSPSMGDESPFDTGIALITSGLL